MSPGARPDRRARRLRAGLLLLAGLVALRVVVLPWRASVAEARAALEAERRLLQSEFALLDEMRLFAGQLDSLEAQLVAAASRLLTDRPDAASAYVARLADGANVRLDSVTEARTGEPAGSDTAALRTVRIRVTGASDLEGILTLLRRIESGQVLLLVDSLGIERESRGLEDPGPERLAFTISLVGFRLDDGNAEEEGTR